MSGPLRFYYPTWLPQGAEPQGPLVLECSPSSSVSAPPAADTDRPAVPDVEGEATTAPRANQDGAA